MSDDNTPTRTYDDLRAQLRELTRSTYIVNEKMPNRGYERRWKIHLLLNDGSVIDTDVADTHQALNAEMRRLIGVLKRGTRE